MLNVATERYLVRVGDRFTVNFQRTLRLPDDGREYPLPPGLGAFPIFKAADFSSTPAEWRTSGDLFLPMYQREALWIGFDAASWKPNAVQVGAGNINAISGETWSEELKAVPQNYLVCPDQPWLDGINVGGGQIRQFVAMPLGTGATVEAQLSTEPEAGGIRVAVYEPKPGVFPDEPPPPSEIGLESLGPLMGGPPPEQMGLAAGGTMRQKIYPDPHGIEVWDQSNKTSFFVHIVTPEAFRELTGMEPPPTPVDASVYTRYGFPWFDLYDEEKGTLEGPASLRSVKSVAELEGNVEPALDVPDEQIWRLKTPDKPSGG